MVFGYIQYDFNSTIVIPDFSVIFSFWFNGL